MPANIAEEISAEKVVALEGSESDLEKFDESDSEDEEGAVVGKSDQEDGSNVKVPPSTSEGSVIKCSNCDEPMGASHQCGDFSSPKEVENRSRTIKNLQKFCAVCEIFYKYGTHHQCETGKPEIVKCIVCQALGRETSLVLCGSICPSCGVPANKLPIEL